MATGVEACPVGYFDEGDNARVINPDECICGVCEPECPAEAIFPDTQPDLESWLKLNAKDASGGLAEDKPYRPIDTHVTIPSATKGD